MGQRQKHKRVNRESKKPYFEPGQTCDRPKVDTVKVTMQRAHVLSKGDPIDRRGRDNAVPASLQMYNSDPLPEASGSASPKTKSVQAEQEAYYAALIGAIRERLCHDGTIFSAVHTRIDTIIRAALTRAASKLKDPYTEEEYKRTVKGYVALIFCMESPYQLHATRWSKGFTPEEILALESVIMVRYLAGWWADEEGRSFQQSGKRGHETLAKYINGIVRIKGLVTAPTPATTPALAPAPASLASNSDSEEEIITVPLPKAEQMAKFMMKYSKPGLKTYCRSLPGGMLEIWYGK